MTDANKRQVGGDHYKKGGEEHWDRAWRLRYDPFQYIITKWVERWRDKGGVEDLYKAQHAIQKYIEILSEVLLDSTAADPFNFQDEVADCEPTADFSHETGVRIRANFFRGLKEAGVISDEWEYHGDTVRKVRPAEPTSSYTNQDRREGSGPC